MSTTYVGSGGWKDAVIGVVYLCFVGTAFIGVTTLVAALFVGH